MTLIVFKAGEVARLFKAKEGKVGKACCYLPGKVVEDAADGDAKDIVDKIDTVQ